MRVCPIVELRPEGENGTSSARHSPRARQEAALGDQGCACRVSFGISFVFGPLSEANFDIV
jgi:hypothetical protein